MKKLLALALVALMAGGALAQEFGDLGGAMGMFFSETEYTDATTNTNETSAQFRGYIVIQGCPDFLTGVGGYEVGITIPGTVFVLSAGGPNGWTNFGNNTNHLAAYQTAPVTVTGNAAVLGYVEMLYTGTDPIEIQFGPADPSSFGPGGNPYGVEWDGPGIADGADPDLLYICHLTGGISGQASTVATLHGDGIVATEEHTLSDVKALFE